MEKALTLKTHATNAIENLGRSLILNVLEKLDRGKLEVTMPDGQIFNYGAPNSRPNEIRAAITIKDNRFFSLVLLNGDIGLGEAYVNNFWNSPEPDKVLEWFILNIEKIGMASGSKGKTTGLNLLQNFNKVKHLLKRNSKTMAAKNIYAHYDLGNEFFKTFLDPSMAYSCAYFDSLNDSLEKAQINKFQKICDELDLKPGMTVLEIGCGWGGLACYMAKKYQVKVIGITISQEQFHFACALVKEKKLEHLIEIKICDYRDITGNFDRIVSIEMAEAVGHEFLPIYFEKIDQSLKKSGLAVLQVITSPDSRYEEFRAGVDWIQTYIFPGSLLPSIGRINESLKSTQLHFFKLNDIGLHYAETLKRWRVQMNSQLHRLKQLSLDDTFIRKWNYYLYYCEAAFRSRNISTIQLTLIKPNNTEAKCQKFQSL